MELISPTDFAKETMQAVQDYSQLAGQAVSNLFRPPLYVADTMQQADLIGFGSLPIVVLTGLLTGAELALNSANTLQRFGSLSFIGQLVSVGMVRELGPIITGLMVAGRNASGMASELGSMIVTEQIDAMRALGTDPMKKLVTPRVVATVFMLFFLTIISDLLGLFGGAVVSTFMFGMDSHQYWSTSCQILVFQDVLHGPGKAIAVRLHHRDRRVLLRNDRQGWNARSRPRDYPGRGGFLRHDSDSGFLRHQVADELICVSVKRIS